MSFSNLQQNNDDDIRLSNVFRHHLVRSLSPQEGNTRNNPLTGILDEEPMKKEERKSKIMNTER